MPVSKINFAKVVWSAQKFLFRPCLPFWEPLVAIFFTDSAALQAVSECPWHHLIHRKTRLSSIVSQPIKVDVVDVVVVVLVVVVVQSQPHLRLNMLSCGLY